MAVKLKKIFKNKLHFNMLTSDLGVDLGTSNVLIYVEGKGVVVREPSVVAVDKNSGKVLRVGSDARNMLGRTPGNVVAMRPLKDGVISDHEMTVKMLQILFRKAIRTSVFNPKPRVVICVPSGVTEVEERTVINAAIEAGARRVYLIEEPLAAALGAQLPIDGANGHMLIDIGGGTTDVAVLSLNGVANSSSVEVAGDAFDEEVARYIRRRYGIIIGQVTAENVKIQIGCVTPRPFPVAAVVKGRDAKTGLPREVEDNSEEIRQALQAPAAQIVDEVLHVLENTSPELVGDMSQNGITLTGGSSQIYCMDELLTAETGIACTRADDADSCVVYGCGKSLGWIKEMNEGPINLARKRIMRE